ncbi:MAG: hypothetical protein ACOH2H_26335 [Cypionkella sp.]
MKLIFALLVACLSSSPAYSGEADARAARLMVAAFECAAFASYANLESGNFDKVQHLEKVGYAAGKQFFAAARAGTITDVDRRDIPIGLFLRTGTEFISEGQSDDFMIGRIYGLMSSVAERDMFERDSTGRSLSQKDWITGPISQMNVAVERFYQRNCGTF